MRSSVCCIGFLVPLRSIVLLSRELFCSRCGTIRRIEQRVTSTSGAMATAQFDPLRKASKRSVRHRSPTTGSSSPPSRLRGARSEETTSTSGSASASWQPSPPLALTEEFYDDRANLSQWRAFLRKSRVADADLSLSLAVALLGEFILPPANAIANHEPFPNRRWKPGGPWS